MTEEIAHYRMVIAHLLQCMQENCAVIEKVAMQGKVLVEDAEELKRIIASAERMAETMVDKRRVMQ